MGLYTFVLDYAGGTYFSQLRAPAVEEAFAIWLDGLLPGESAGGVSMAVFNAFADAGDDDLVPIEGLENVWCLASLDEDDPALLNIIATAPAPGGITEQGQA